MGRPEFSSRMLLPRYWATWLGFGLWWLMVQLPVAAQMKLGTWLGMGMKAVAKRRIAIIDRNLALCFPALSDKERLVLRQTNMDAMGKGFMEIGMAWFMSHRRMRRTYSVEGLEHLEKAREQGIGVLLMGMHFTTIDYGAAVISMNHSIDGSYRPHKNPVYDYIQRKGRERHNDQGIVIARGDLRTMIKRLRQGRAVWYAPDQDYGPQHSVFVPFFGVDAATITATSRLAKMGRALVIPFTHHRISDSGRYQVKVYPPLSEFPGENEEADARRINAFVEACINECPSQYLWAHRRFKTRPEGQPDLYRSVGIAAGKRD